MIEAQRAEPASSAESLNDDKDPMRERCDRCGAQAFVCVTLSEGDLFFCAHHYTAHEDVLEAQAIFITDQREQMPA